MFITITLLVCSIWNIGFGFVMKTKNIESSLIFKVIPFFMGMALFMCYLDRIGLIKLTH